MKFVELKNKNNESLAPINLNYEKRISNLEKAKNIITASFITNHTITETGIEEKTALNDFISCGTKLTLKNSGIKVGSGITKVKVSANVNFQTITEGLKYISIYKNTDTQYTNPTYVSARMTVDIAPVLLEVSEGDYIYLYVQGTAGDVLRRGKNFSNITVEVVE